MNKSIYHYIYSIHSYFFYNLLQTCSQLTSFSMTVKYSGSGGAAQRPKKGDLPSAICSIYYVAGSLIAQKPASSERPCMWGWGIYGGGDDKGMVSYLHDDEILWVTFCITDTQCKEVVWMVASSHRGSVMHNFDWLVQERQNSSVIAMELHLSCTNT